MIAHYYSGRTTGAVNVLNSTQTVDSLITVSICPRFIPSTTLSENTRGVKTDQERGGRVKVNEQSSGVVGKKSELRESTVTVGPHVPGFRGSLGVQV